MFRAVSQIESTFKAAILDFKFGLILEFLPKLAPFVNLPSLLLSVQNRSKQNDDDVIATIYPSCKKAQNLVIQDGCLECTLLLGLLV